ncbi:MAG: hypothetical protein BWY76_03501 [bacterium ADurb.Bin429]|nr:MAG: hypothetical protein BWY76_03501 [bacterium ADurb.Bin429]
MFHHPLYLVWGLIVLALTGVAEYRGWSLTPLNEVKDVPRSVRDNPGAYRSIYRGFPHYTGGK